MNLLVLKVNRTFPASSSVKRKGKKWSTGRIKLLPMSLFDSDCEHQALKNAQAEVQEEAPECRKPDRMRQSPPAAGLDRNRP